MSQNLAKRSLRDILFTSDPNHLILAGVNNRNVMITQRFHATPVQANRDFSWHYWLYISTVSTFHKILASYEIASSGFRLLGEIPAGAINQWLKSLVTGLKLEMYAGTQK